MSVEEISQPESVQSTVRTSQTMGLSRTIALGASVVIGLAVFVLLGMILDIARSRAALSYGLVAVLFLPLVLAYAERGAAFPNGRGVFRLGREDDPSWFVYAGQWLGIAGFGVLIALLGWGAAFHLDLLLNRLFSISVEQSYLGIVVVVLVSIIRSISSRGTWRTRVRLVYLSVPVLILVVGLGWFSADQIVVMQLAVRSPGDTVLAVAMLGALLWGTALILEQRDQMRQPSRYIFPALYVALLLGSLSGLAASYVALDTAAIAPGDPIPLASISAVAGSLAEIFYLLLGLSICFIAMDRSIVSSLRQVGSMMQDGFIPHEVILFDNRLKISVSRLLIVVLLSILLLAFISFDDTVALSAGLFFLITILVFGIDLLRPRLRLPKARGLKLPFHPLFPGIAVAVSVYFSLVLPRELWIGVVIWGILGLIYYFAIARTHSMAMRRQERVVVEEISHLETETKAFRILIDVSDSDDISSLIKAGLQLAKAGDGQIFLGQVLVHPAHMPLDMERQIAGRAFQSLKSKISEIDYQSVPLETLIRLAPSRSTGILETVREEDIDLVLVGWRTGTRSTDGVLDPEINQIVQSAPCDVGVLHGSIPGSICSVSVSTRGGPHAGEALKYGQWLTQEGGEKVLAVNIVRGSLTVEREAEAMSQLANAVEDAGEPEAYEARVVQAKDIKRGIVKEVEGSDLLLLGASTKGLLDEAVFDGIPVDVAQARKDPTLLIKHYEGAGQFWLRRLWKFIYTPFPTLTVGDRTDVNRRIRQSSVASVDFYALIILASVIAVLGLIQNSAAVIIGAMLVAPLMSPILALAFSLVLGDARLLARAGESTIKGVLVAVVVSVAVAVILPPQPITAEVLARTQPNFLDLIVALASGAAAAYALARKQLAAALPGVAIAAALVPPLCVVGFGLGYGMYTLAGGALLLFVTNLSAIVFAGAITFLLLGFRPVRAEFGQRIQRWILLTIVILIVIATPLVLTTINLRQRLDRQQKVQEVLNQEIEDEFAEVEDVTIQSQAVGFLVSGTIYAYGDVTSQELELIQEKLSDAIGAPVFIRARIIDARLELVGDRTIRETGIQP